MLALVLAASLGTAPPAVPPRVGLVSFRRVPAPDDSPVHLSTALAQDRDGFLWIGTQGGLVRYDGYQFRLFRPDPADPRSLPGAYVRSLLATKDGRVFAGTFADGLAVHDPASESFTRYAHDPARPDSLPHDRVEALAEDGRGVVWAATDAGLARIDPRTGLLARPAGLSGARLRAVFADGAGNLWVGGRGGLFVSRDGGEVFTPVALGPGAQPIVTHLLADERGRIWVGTTDAGVAVLEDGGARWLRPRPAQADGLDHYWVYAMAPGAPGEMWVGTFGGGIDVVELATLAVVDRLRHDDGIPVSVGSDRIGALFRDAAGVVWVGTWGQGLQRHDPSSRAFRTLWRGAVPPQTLSHPSAVRALPLADGAVWVGTNGNGVDVLDRDLRPIAAHRPDARDPGALDDGSVTCLAQGPDGTVWVATLGGTLHRRAPGARAFVRLGTRAGLPGGPIRALAFDPSGAALWAGSSEGLARIDVAASAVTSWRHDPSEPRSLSGSAVEAIAFARDGTLWVGTDRGLNAFDPASGTAVRVLADGRADGLPANWVPDLMVASDGRLWVATSGGAAVLTSWDGRTARFESVSRRLGRAPDRAESLIEDAQGSVWIGPGLLRVDPRAWTARAFAAADGAVFRSLFIASRARSASGTLFFGSPEGLLVVDPAAVRPWEVAPPVRLTALRVGDAAAAGASRATQIALSPRERGFEVSFAALDFSAPERNEYRYLLEGFDPEWRTADASRRTAAYTNLPPGAYVLHVRGSNRVGVLGTQEVRLPVTVAPAWHQTPFARVAFALAALCAAYALHRARMQRLSMRSRELARLVDERTRDLQEANARIERASLTDPLTGLGNRRFLERQIGSDVEIALRRHEGGLPESDLVFLLIDVDHFKRVNDTHGHAAGDAVLQGVAAVLREHLRASDHAVRWGGEEFLAVARFVDRGTAGTLGEKLRAAIAETPFLADDGTRIALTCSIGFAAYPLSRRVPRALGWEGVIEAADVALYAAKRGGRNRCVGLDAADAGDPARVVEAMRAKSGGADAPAHGADL
jgi:diguanylate cyclase (GGDEF)-like protein